MRFLIKQRSQPQTVYLTLFRVMAFLGRLLVIRRPIFNQNCLIAFVAALQIDKRKTTPYRPQTDGMVERFNRTLDDLFSTLELAHQRDWDDFLPLMLAAYRFTPHSATGFSPFELLYGRSPNMPLNLIAPPLLPITPPPDVSLSSTVPQQLDYISTVQSSLQSIWQQASSNLDAAAQQRIAMYNKRSHDRLFHVGDLVLVTRPPAQSTINPKWAPRHHGPYRVVEKISDHTYRLFNPKESGLKRSSVVHVDHLLLLRPRPDALLSPADRQILSDLQVSVGDTDPTIERATASRKKPSSSKQYTIDSILEHCVDLDQVLWFLVRWRGYTGQSDSWIPESNLKDCPTLVNTYWATVGRRNYIATAVPAVEYAAPSQPLPRSSKRKPVTASKTARTARSAVTSSSSKPSVPVNSVPLKKPSVPVKNQSVPADVPSLAKPPDDLVIVTLATTVPELSSTVAADPGLAPRVSTAPNLAPLVPVRRRSPRLAAAADSFHTLV